MSTINLKRSVRILYVEDNDLNQLIVKRMLNVLGYEEVLIAANAAEATALLENPANHINLILMDLGLPDIDGITLAKKIRNSQWQAKNVPIIAVTGNEEVEAKNKSFAVGMNEFLIKPVDKDLLGATLKKFLQNN